MAPKENVFAPLVRRFVPWERFRPVAVRTIAGGEGVAALDPAAIGVLNWNIARNNHGALWQKDFAAIRARYAPDLLFLQEVRLERSEKLRPELTDLHWNYAPNFVDAHHDAYSGILTAARAVPLWAKALLTRDAEPLSGTPKASLVSLYALTGLDTALLVLNCHFINFVSLEKFRAQMGELERHIAVHRGPVLFSGDFNTWNPPRRLLLEQVARRFGLTPVVFGGATGRGDPSSLLTLDYIFYRGLRLTRSERLRHVFSSDHKPLIAEFSI